MILITEGGSFDASSENDQKGCLTRNISGLLCFLHGGEAYEQLMMLQAEVNDPMMFQQRVVHCVVKTTGFYNKKKNRVQQWPDDSNSLEHAVSMAMCVIVLEAFFIERKG